MTFLIKFIKIKTIIKITIFFLIDNDIKIIDNIYFYFLLLNKKIQYKLFFQNSKE